MRRGRLRSTSTFMAVIAVMAAGLVGGMTAAVAAATPSPAFDAPYLDGVSGPRPATAVDLAGTWSFIPVTNTLCTNDAFGAGPMDCHDEAASRTQTTIAVPGGGWVKQGYANLSTAVYRRTMTVPDIHAPQVTKLFFGAVNHEATLFVDGRKVATNMTSYTASTFDLTSVVTPGRSYQIDVLVRGRKAFVGADGRYTVPEGASWSHDVAQGIF